MPMRRLDSVERRVGPEFGARPLVSFYRLIPQARLPQRADRSAGGTLPTRAYRYCEPSASASAYGWYIFPPIDFSLIWNGTDVLWSYKGSKSWYPLGAAQFPGFSRYFDSHAPDDVKSFAPPFLGAATNPGIIQLWTGVFARTAPGWSLLVRPPANLARSKGFELYEGLIETDRWFGPLITNLRLTKTDMPIEIRKDYPLVQVQPVPRIAYANETLASFEIIEDLAGFGAAEWQRYRETVVAPNIAPVRQRGAYAAASRRQQKKGCPVHGSAIADSDKRSPR
jgi:hypothetical protein